MPGHEQVTQQLREFVVNSFLFGTGQALGDQDSFIENGIIDSTGVLELVSHLEELYGIEVLDEEMVPENLDSIDSLSQYVSRKLAGSASTASAGK